MRDSSFNSVFIVVAIIFVLVSFARGVFVNESEAARALETQGYRDVKITNDAWLFVGLRGCDEGDAARFTAVASNPTGKRVEIYVCAGWPFKGSTIRTK